MTKENMAIRIKPIEVKTDEPNAVTYAAMDNAEKDEDMYGPYDSVSDLIEALNA